METFIVDMLYYVIHLLIIHTLHIIYAYLSIKIKYILKMNLKLCLFIIFLSTVYTTDNGLGLTPPMGWNSWNHFGCNINQQLIKKTAQLLIETGLASKGYKYVNLDDCWQISRNETTKQILEDKQKFPSGIKTLAEYIHSKNLLFGLYSDAGQKTCEGRPGGYGFQKIDAQTYAKWNVDYLKYDNCYNMNISGKIRYYAMHKALNESGRHIFYSMCNWGQEKSWQWASPYANSWRTTGDISDNWKSFTKILDQQVGLEKFSQIGGWNDPDMLEVGNGGMTFDQYYAHFALWAALKSPLLIGCSLQSITPQTLQILGNEELIAVNQDSLGIQARRLVVNVRVDSRTEVWGGPLSGNRWVIIFLNRAEKQEKISIKISESIKIQYDNYSMRDIINHKDLGVKTEDTIEVTVKKHAVSVLIVKFYKSEIKSENSSLRTENMIE